MGRRPILQEYERSESPAGYVSFYRPCSVRPAHFHGQLELLVVTRGHFSCLVGSQTYVVQAPALVWHLPTVGHQTLEASSDCFFWVVMFEPFFAERILSSAVRVGEGPPRFSLAPRVERVADAQSPFASWIFGLTNLVAGRPVVEIRGCTADAVSELGSRAIHAETPAQLTQLLGEILRLAVDESERQLSHIAFSPSLSELGIALLLAAPELERDVACRELAVSTSYLARLFQRQTGATFADFRNRARVVSFLAAATQRSTSLLQAALASGFGTYTQAHRVFSNLTGYCPTCYLQSGGRSKLSELTIDSLTTA
jgi:AraC-like DNA-binding protein